MTEALKLGDVPLALELQNIIWLDGPFRKPEQVNAAIRQSVTTMNTRPLTEGTFFKADAQPLDTLDPPAVKRLGKIEVPTLVVAGALDDPEIVRAGNLMAKSIPGARKYIIEDSAHLANLEHPGEFNKIVLTFLRDAAQNPGTQKAA